MGQPSRVWDTTLTFQAVSQWKPGDDAGLQRFLLEHYLEHRLFTDYFLGLPVPIKTLEYPLQTMVNPQQWLADHQMVSQSQWSAAGCGESVDLERVNWGEPRQVQDWQIYHAAWHASLRDSLNL